jgi:hypothetical protein
MKRLYHVVPTCAAVVLALALRPAGNAEGQTGPGVRQAQRAPVLNQLLGAPSLKGKVVLDGRRPDLKRMNADMLAAINAKADDKNYCLMSPEDQKTAQEWRVGDNNGVGNVFVWIEPLTRRDFFKIDEKQFANVPKEASLEQPYCAVVPHCLILFPKYRDPKDPKRLLETGQKFVVKNDARIAHNVKVEAGPKNPEFNQVLGPKTKRVLSVLEPCNDVIVIRCGIHPWMSAYARAFDHPYAALTVVGKGPKDANYGTYEIKNVPAGKVRVIAWHERAGYLGKGAKGEDIELRAGANTKNFTMTAR